jgi:hypothetical protein
MDSAKQKNNRVLYGIIGLLSLVVIFLGYKLMQEKSQVDVFVEETIPELEFERNNLEMELEDMFEQYDTLTVENEELNADLIAQKEEVSKLMDQVAKLDKNSKAYKWEIGKLKKEAGTLREIMKGYLHEIDSLNQANAELTAKADNLTQNLTKVTGEKQTLESQVEKQDDIIKTGSILQAMNVNAMAIRVKASGNQVETSRASRTEMIKSCCTLGENRITQSGTKTIYIRVISPEGAVLANTTQPNATFKYDGISGKYSVKRDIQYDNSLQDLCVFYTVADDLATGQYIVEMYESGTLIGKTNFDLR